MLWGPEVYGHVVDATWRGDGELPSDLDSRGHVPRCVVVDDAFDWEDDRPPGRTRSETVVYEAHVRNQTMLHPGRARGAPGDVCRSRAPGVRRPPELPRGDGRRAAPRARVHPGAVPRAPGHDEPLGLQHPRVLRAARRLRGRRRPAGCRRRGQGHGQAPPPRGHRGDPRRRLQPHRRAGPHRRDAVVARPGPARLLPARRARPRHRRHGVRQHPRPAPPRRLPDGARLPAHVGAGVPRRRLPVRPRRRPGPWAWRRVRPRPPLPRRAAHRPRALAGQAHRRALGRRHARLAHRPVPAALHGVERPVPRHGPPVLDRRRAGADARAPRPRRAGPRDPAGRLTRPLRPP